MTISENQMETYQATVADFSRQAEENTCLPVVLVNILDELAERHSVPSIRIEKEEILEMVDYDPLLGSVSDYLPERIDPLLNEFNYEIVEERALTMEDLEDIIIEDNASYPLVEFDSRYFDWVDGYDADGGMYGQTQPHTVVPFGFNEETVLIFDPFEDFYLPPSGGGTPPKKVPQPLFYEWWKGESTPGWTLWVQEREQHKLGDLMDQ